MFKRTKSLFCGIAAILLLAGCGGGQPSTGDDDFDQNKVPHGQGIEMYVIGTYWNSWNTATIKEASGCAFKKDTSTGFYTVDLTITDEMVAGNAEFKFIATNSWSDQYGMEDVNWEGSNDAFKNQYPGKTKHDWHEGKGNRSNIKVVTAGSWHIEYNPANFTGEEVEGVALSNKFTISIK